MMLSGALPQIIFLQAKLIAHRCLRVGKLNGLPLLLFQRGQGLLGLLIDIHNHG
jgi:hypothetical protein